MAEVQKPAITAETPVVEPTTAPVVPVTTEAPTELAVPKIEEPLKAEDETTATAGTVEEKKDEAKKEEKPVEPILSGALGYKAPGLKNAFRFSKKYFWFSEEPVSVQDLNDYLRGEKADVAHPTAAWSSQSGKGLLYFVKHADNKNKPAGVLNLTDATDLLKDGTIAFHFKLHGHKHTFEAQNAPERNGWFVAVQNAIDAGKAEKETITQSEAYKAELEKLGKPATLAATAAKESSAHKKSVEVPKSTEPTEPVVPVVAAPVVAEGSTPARAGSSSSSSSSDEEKKKKKSKSKSRSVSRGKRASIFGGFLGKKDKAEEKVEEKKEEHEAKKADKAEETPVVAPVAEASTAAPVIPVTEEPAKPAELPKTEDSAPVAAIAPATTEDKVEEKPKVTKRGSIFGNFVEKLRSPTSEKKESDILPPAAAKEPETTAAAPKVDETPAVTAPVIAPLDGPTETPKTEEIAKVDSPKAEEAKEVKPAATTPHKEKQSFSFGKFLGGGKEKIKSPTGEKSTEKALETPVKTEEPAKVEETPAPLAAAAPTPVEPVAETKDEPVTETTPPKKRGSIFGTLIRNASKAGRSKKEKEVTSTPAKVEEAAEPKEETPAVASTEEKETPVVPAPASTEPATIGDVVPSAVTVGQAPKSTTQVSSTA
ncbi:Pleckstrin homology domain-containing protein [Dendryphion nanum]|uniref:Pleckstrin homology domain-containing protein n=1 Tax=Dendryphion nanum TaxID=256645 RepID=A0A9P9D8P9_9PLEO|nr:Pleckstrin homology domain-containing protein [Dendryphion nanum]